MAELPLPECQPVVNDMRLQIGLLQRDVADHGKLIDKLSEGIEKIEEMNTNLVKLLAVHDQKHETHDKIEDDIDSDIKDLHSRITTVSREIQDRLDVVKRELYTHLDTLFATHHGGGESQAAATKVLKQLEKWKYMILGGALVLGYLVDHINWSVLLQLFGK